MECNTARVSFCLVLLGVPAAFGEKGRELEAVGVGRGSGPRSRTAV